jgi:hypothetical protein
MDADGFQPVGAIAEEFRQATTAHAQKEYAAAFKGFRPAEPSVRAVRDLVAVCRAEGIPVAFLVPPVSPAFRASFAPGVADAGETCLRDRCRELGVPLFPPLVDMAEDEFMDGHHMLRHGAERYSRWLADTHLKPWLAGHGWRVE